MAEIIPVIPIQVRTSILAILYGVSHLMRAISDNEWPRVHPDFSATVELIV